MWECMSGYGCNWGGMGLGMMGMSLFWILLIAIIVLLVKGLWCSGKQTRSQQEKTALDILKERYARGDIDKAEFGEKKADECPIPWPLENNQQYIRLEQMERIINMEVTS